MAEWTELKALITQFDEQKTEAERKVKEADIVLSYLRAALADLKDLDGQKTVARPQAKPEPQPEPEPEQAVEEPVEAEATEEAAAAAGGGSSKASISALLGGDSETNWDRMD